MTPEQFIAALEQMPLPQPVFYRLYYDDHGSPLFYSMEDLPGNYIEVDQETFRTQPMRVKVKQGKLIKVTWHTVQKLRPNVLGTQCHPQDVAVIVDSNGIFWNKQTYEQN